MIPDTLSRAAQPELAAAGGESLPLQDVLGVQAEYAISYGPPSWVAKPQEEGTGSQELKAHVMELALAQVVATQECEKEVAATHGLGGGRAIT